MIKLARKYSFDKYGRGRAAIVTLNNSFHGRTITTLTATGQDVEPGTSVVRGSTIRVDFVDHTAQD